MTAALEGGEWSSAIPGHILPPGKTRYPFYRRLGGAQGRSGRMENPVPTGIPSRTVQPVVVAIPTELTGPRPCNKNQQNAHFLYSWFNLIIVSSTCFEHRNFHPREGLYCTCGFMGFLSCKHISSLVDGTPCHRPGCLYGWEYFVSQIVLRTRNCDFWTP